MNVPSLPTLPDELLGLHAEAHASFATQERSADPSVRRLFRMLQHRLTVESLAYVQAVVARPDRPAIVPPPRAFLTRTQELRLQGARAAFRHLDSRVSMRDMGASPRVLDRTTPLVLHALLEGPTPSGRETNPGLLRATPTAWKPESNSFMHPPASMCAELVDSAIGMALDAPAPACARAAWLTYAMLSIHPFVDGNGRTSRALYLAVASEELPLGIDWGILEQWSIARHGYIDALQAGQQMERYDPTKMDALPFMKFSTEASVAGAHLCMQRIDLLGARLEEVATVLGITVERAAPFVAVEMLRNASLEELLLAGFDRALLDDVIAELLNARVLRWADRPASRRTCESDAHFGLVVA